MFSLSLRVLVTATFILLPAAVTPSVKTNTTLNANVSPLGLAHDPGLGRVYSIKDVYCGEDFFDGWIWEAIKDPTHGRVNYVSKEDAIRLGLSYGESSMPI